MKDIFDSVDILKHNTYISYRIWVKNKYTLDILKILMNKYHVDISYKENNSIKLDESIYLNFNDEFTWPDLNIEKTVDLGKCYALKDHIGILVDGTIVPCCLDSKGTINLGNIFKTSLDEVINSGRYQFMLTGFSNNKKCEELCKKCDFIK